MPTANEPASGWQLIGDGAEAYERFLVPSRRMTRTTIATALALAAALGGATPARADTTLTSCAPPEFAAAVAAGGIVRFAVDCPTLIPATTTTVGAGKVLVIEGDGHTVTLRGANQRRLFRVTGGQLTVRGVTLQGGAAVGANGAAGTPGTAGIAGASGSSGVTGSAGVAGTSGGAGRNGSVGTAGGRGAAGTAGLRRSRVHLQR